VERRKRENTVCENLEDEGRYVRSGEEDDGRYVRSREEDEGRM
jgi:hypothetical protein